ADALRSRRRVRADDARRAREHVLRQQPQGARRRDDVSTFEVTEMKVRRPKQVSYDFSGTSVLITGAAHGQGKLHALRFAEAGADVALCDIAGGSLPTVAYPLGSGPELEAVAE